MTEPSPVDEPPLQHRTPDRGFTLVEIVVAITLLGIASGGVLAALGASITGSSKHRELATATAWLQSAADHLEIVPMVVCGVGKDPRLAYEQEIQGTIPEPLPPPPTPLNTPKVPNSDGWASTKLTVQAVTYWNGASFGATCYDDLQLVSLKAVSPNDKVTQTLDVIKGSPYLELVDPSGETDDAITCTLTSATFTSKKTGAVVGPPTKLKLKKPSATKASHILDNHITITVVTSGTCVGKLRFTYQYPHKDHFHTRTINLKLLKGTTNTYIGKLGHHGDKFTTTSALTLKLQEGRKKSKTWGDAINGLVPVGFV